MTKCHWVMEHEEQLTQATNRTAADPDLPTDEDGDRAGAALQI